MLKARMRAPCRMKCASRCRMAPTWRKKGPSQPGGNAGAGRGQEG